MRVLGGLLGTRLRKSKNGYVSVNIDEAILKCGSN